MWDDYRASSVLKGFQSFVIIIFFLLWVATGSAELLYAFLVVALIYYPVHALKTVAFHVSPSASARPVGASDCRAFKGANTASKTGMPSGHSAGAAAMAVYALGYIWYVAETSIAQKVVGTSMVVVLALLIAFSRIVYKCHTFAQVLVGLAIGCAWGAGAFTLRENAVERLKMWTSTV